MKMEVRVNSILEKDTPKHLFDKSHFKGMRAWIGDAEKAYNAGNKKLTIQILNN